MKYGLFHIAAGLSLAIASFAASSAPYYKAVFIQNRQVCVSLESGSGERCLTSDQIDKFLPVWSSDGRKIAYLQASPDPRSLSVLVVIDQDGRLLRRLDLKSIVPGEIRSGMRQVEALEWIASNKIAVSGSVNPSTTEYLLVDVVKGAVEDEFFDDGFGASFAPDGSSHVSLSGAPHFTPQPKRAPMLSVDHEIVLNLPAGASLGQRPIWSPDGLTVAVPLRRLAGAQDSKIDSVLIWSRSSRESSLIDLPAVGERNSAIYWADSDLVYARTDPGKAPNTETWLLSMAATPSKLLRWQRGDERSRPNRELLAQRLREETRRSFRVPGATDLDLWCENCDLRYLRRRAPTPQ